MRIGVNELQKTITEIFKTLTSELRNEIYNKTIWSSYVNEYKYMNIK